MSRKEIVYASDLHLERDWAFAPGHYFKIDWQKIQDEFPEPKCWLVALDDRKLNLIFHLLSIFPRYYRNWGYTKETLDVNAWDEIQAFVSETELCLMSGCDVDQMNEYLERIAIALESIDDKAVQRITWQEILDDLETTLGVGHIFYKILDWFFGLFPSIKLKADATPMIMGFWEYLSWKRPMKEAAQSIATATWVNAIASGGSTMLIGILTGWQTLTLWVLDWIKGDKTLWETIAPFLGLAVPDSEGGTGGEDPDNDPGLRAITNIFLEQQAMSVTQNNTQTVNCGGGCGGLGGGVCFVADESGAGSSIDQPEYTLPVTGPENNPPPSGWDSWTGEDGYYAYKCKAANSMTLGIAETLYQLGDIGNGSYTGSTHAVTARNIETAFRNWMLNIVEHTLVNPPPVFAQFVDDPLLVITRSWVAQKIADYFYPTPDTDPFQIFYDLRLDWLNDREDRVCELYNVESTSEAKTVILAAADTYFAGYSYTADEKAWARAIIEGMLLNSWLNLLFSKNDVIDQYEDETAVDCADCEEELEIFGYPCEGLGILEKTDENEYHFTSEADPNFEGDFYYNFRLSNSNCFTISSIDLTDYTLTPVGDCSAENCSDHSDMGPYDAPTIPDLENWLETRPSMYYFYVRSDTAFEFDITIVRD